MTDSLGSDAFQQRVHEIDEFFNLVKILEEKAQNQSGRMPLKFSELSVSDEQFKIMKSSFMVMLYNFAEASIRDGIDSIYEHLKENNVSFDDVHINLKIEILRSVKNAALKADEPDNIIHSIKKISHHIISEFYSNKSLFNGNVDARKIRSVAAQYGFSSIVTHEDAKGGERLQDVKDKRNTLAHGRAAFSEIGRDITFSQMEDARKQTVSYVEGILDNIQAYLDEEHYLAAKSA